jgi:hypothetical protein
MRLIFVPLADRPECAVALTGTFELAGDLGAGMRHGSRAADSPGGESTACAGASSRPVLILPQSRDTTLGSRICIAWNQSRDAALAVASVLPLLQRVQHVSIVSAGPENRPGPKSGQLAAYVKA